MFSILEADINFIQVSFSSIHADTFKSSHSTIQPSSHPHSSLHRSNADNAVSIKCIIIFRVNVFVCAQWLDADGMK